MSLNAFKYVEELRNAGVPDKQAETQVRILTEIIESNLATKRDIKELEDKIEQRMIQMEQKMIQMEQRMTIKLGSLMIISITLLVGLSQLGVF